MSSKIRFDILTVFPETFESYLNASMMKRARARKLVDVRVHDLRKFIRDKHKKVDDRPYGGGPGMVIKIEPIVRALSNLKLKVENKKLKIILFSADGKQFNANMAANFAKKYNHIVMIAGHYEGVDERVKKVIRDSGFAVQELSVGPFVLTGGELPAMIVVDAVSRHIPGFLGKESSLEEKRYGIGIPAYTRPEAFLHRGKKYQVPSVLLSGDHKKIDAWRVSQIKKRGT